MKNFRKFQVGIPETEISLCLQTLVCLFWFPMFIYIFLIVCFGSQCLFTFFWCKHTLFWKIFENFKPEFRNLKFRFVCKHWSVCFGFQCLFTFFWLFVLVPNVYLHFFDVNTLCFQNFRKFAAGISKTLKFRSVCKHWSICFGFQCLPTFFRWKYSYFFFKFTYQLIVPAVQFTDRETKNAEKLHDLNWTIGCAVLSLTSFYETLKSVKRYQLPRPTTRRWLHKGLIIMYCKSVPFHIFITRDTIYTSSAS